MKRIPASSLRHGDTLVSVHPDARDAFVVVDGECLDHWDIIVLETDEPVRMSVGNQTYDVGRRMRKWLYKLHIVAGDYDVFRDGSLLPSSR